jgi:GntR family transcriptional regulator
MSDSPAAKPPGMSHYGWLAALLRSRITGGEWPPGSAIPAESALAREHAVALGTMRQALGVLVEEGLLERVRGSGTFVRNVLSGGSMLRFFRFRGPGGAAGEVPRSEILERRIEPSEAIQAEALGIEKGTSVLCLRRVRSLAGKPCLVEAIWLALPLFEPLVDLPLADWGDLLYPLYHRQAAVTVMRAQDDLSFDLLDARDAVSLLLPERHPCVRVTRRAFDLRGQCVELRHTRGDAFSFHYSAQLR